MGWVLTAPAVSLGAPYFRPPMASRKRVPLLPCISASTE